MLLISFATTDWTESYSFNLYCIWKINKVVYRKVLCNMSMKLAVILCDQHVLVIILIYELCVGILYSNKRFLVSNFIDFPDIQVRIQTLFSHWWHLEVASFAVRAPCKQKMVFRFKISLPYLWYCGTLLVYCNASDIVI